MLITSGGNIGIAYDGANLPAVPTNKFLIQNGNLNGYDPYNNFYDLSMLASAIGLYSISIGAAQNINIPYFSSAINNGVGVINGGVFVNVGGDEAINLGVHSTINGMNGAVNIGYSAEISGDNDNVG